MGSPGLAPDEVPATESLAAGRVERLSGMLRLIVVSGPDQGRALPLRKGSYTVGKARGCDLVLSDGAVSRRHLLLKVRAEGIQVEDLDSKNGSFFQRARFRQIILGAGEVVTIGETELKLVVAGQPEPRPPSTADRFGTLLGRSLAMRQVFAVLERIAPTDASVLIHGETGTGKELCAESLHAASARAARPFVLCDLAAATRSLLESELFGHVRGAFTGADRDRPGAFACADGGTLFIDEIGELELESQPRLLRALEGRQVKPIGSTQHRRVDVRVIAATNRDLRAECAAGRFRLDLYHRLAVLHVTLPPLRERKEDIPFLARHFLAPRSIQLTPEAASLLTEYDWPGNVRELRNILIRATALLADGEVLTPAGLELGDLETGSRASNREPAAVSHGDDGFFEAKRRLVESWERDYLIELVRRADGNVSRAARQGGLDRPYLHRLLKKHGLWAATHEAP